MYPKKYHIHFVGIGGIGMSGIAELLLNLGYKVSGSDLKLSGITRRLQGLGGIIYSGHTENNIKSTNVVVMSSAIRPDNPEIEEAKKLSIPVIQRAEMLAELMRLKYSIAISGTHGKTSTTSIVSKVLEKGNLDPTVVIGGKIKSLGTNAILGKGDFLVAEADESDGSFLKYSPAIAVVTNIDREHLDFYEGIDDIKNAFLNFIERIPFYGLAVLCLDNEHVQDLITKIKKRYTTYGTSTQADLQAKNITFEKKQSTFAVYHLGKKLGDIKLSLPGMHNVSNSLASIAVGLELDISFENIKSALESLEGVQRRMEIKGVVNNITVVDDYGHHPTEIKATLLAIKESWPEKRKVVVFQPHRYTRTKALFDEFTKAFYHSDTLIVLPIHAASEDEIDGINGESLCEGIRQHGHKDVTFVEKEEVVSYLKKNLVKDDLLITLGAGDVVKLGEAFLDEMKNVS